MKKILFLLVLAITLSGGVYADENVNYDLEINIGNKGSYVRI